MTTETVAKKKLQPELFKLWSVRLGPKKVLVAYAASYTEALAALRDLREVYKLPGAGRFRMLAGAKAHVSFAELTRGEINLLRSQSPSELWDYYTH